MSLTRVKWLGEAEVAVDIDATRALSARIAARHKKAAPTGFGGCDCAECRNLAISFAEQFPESVKGLLAELGIDWKQPLEAARLTQDNDKRTLSHTCDYFFVGHAPAQIHFESTSGHGINITGEDSRFGGMLKQLHGSDAAFGNISIDMWDVPWRVDDPYPEYE